MPITIPEVTTALIDVMTAVPDAGESTVWFQRIPGAFGLVTTVPFPTLNGVWVASSEADPQEVLALARELPIGDLPFCLQSCDEKRQGVAGVAADLGMTPGPDVPLMALETVPATPDIPGLTLRHLSADELDRRNEAAGEGFEVPPEAIGLATRVFSGVDGYRMYVGEVDGEVVTTAVGITRGDAVGIFDVATPPRFRGHGYGAAITTHAVRQGLADGASWAWLQSSTEGFGVYERLGFRTVTRWGLWVSST